MNEMNETQVYKEMLEGFDHLNTLALDDPYIITIKCPAPEEIKDQKEQTLRYCFICYALLGIKDGDTIQTTLYGEFRCNVLFDCPCNVIGRSETLKRLRYVVKNRKPFPRKEV